MKNSKKFKVRELMRKNFSLLKITFKYDNFILFWSSFGTQHPLIHLRIEEVRCWEFCNWQNRVSKWVRVNWNGVGNCGEENCLISYRKETDAKVFKNSKYNWEKLNSKVEFFPHSYAGLLDTISKMLPLKKYNYSLR